MATGRLKHWFLSRFVVIAEIVGYVLALAVILGAISTLFFTAEILLPVSGELVSLREAVTLEEECAVAELRAEPGAPVRAGDPVADVVTGSRDMLRVMGLRKVRDGLTLLDTEEKGKIGGVLDTAQTWLEAVAAPDTVTLKAPMAGLVQPSDPASDGDSIEAGQPIVTVYDLTTLTLKASIPANRVDRVAEGMPARTTYPDLDIVLEGTVVSVTTDDEGTTALLRFDNVPQQVQTENYDLIFGDDPGAPPSVSANIIIGQQSLFSRLFSKRQ